MPSNLSCTCDLQAVSLVANCTWYIDSTQPEADSGPVGVLQIWQKAFLLLLLSSQEGAGVCCTPASQMLHAASAM